MLYQERMNSESLADVWTIGDTFEGDDNDELSVFVDGAMDEDCRCKHNIVISVYDIVIPGSIMEGEDIFLTTDIDGGKILLVPTSVGNDWILGSFIIISSFSEYISHNHHYTPHCLVSLQLGRQIGRGSLHASIFYRRIV